MVAKKPSAASCFLSPKRGKQRMVIKRSGAVKTKDWDKIPYVRHGQPTKISRPERAQWTRSLKDFLGNTEEKVTRVLLADKWLRNWTGDLCPFCAKGRLGKLTNVKGRGLRLRCSCYTCHKFVAPHHNHPVFSEGSGSRNPHWQIRRRWLSAMLLVLAARRLTHCSATTTK